MPDDVVPASSSFSAAVRPFRTAVLRGLGVVAPPLLTILIVLWIVRTLDAYVLSPITHVTRTVLASQLADVRTQLVDPEPTADPTVFVSEGERFKRLPSGEFIPLEVYHRVVQSGRGQPPPTTGQEAYRRWVQATYLQPWIVVPVFVIIFAGTMYVLGSIFAARLGRAFWGGFERGIGRLPLVRSVYQATKQVTDYLFSDRELEFTRVVAVEYPSRGVWSLAFVTNEGMADVEAAAGEKMLTVLVPTSPVPVSGYTLLVPKSEVLDVSISVEQAIEYMVSCGVVLPAEQLQRVTA